MTRRLAPSGESTTSGATSCRDASELRGAAEPGGAAGAAALGLDLAVARRRGGHELVEQPHGRLRDRLDGALEGGGIRLRGALHPAHLADVLQRRVVKLL